MVAPRFRHSAVPVAQQGADGVGTPVAYADDRGAPFAVPQRFISAPQVLPPVNVQRQGTPTEELQLPAVLPVQQAPGSQFSTVDPTRYATVISSVVAVGTASAQFLNRPTGKRVVLGMRNSSTGLTPPNIYIDFGTSATVNSFLKLAAGQVVYFDAVVPQNDLYALADGAGGQLSFIYSEQV